MILYLAIHKGPFTQENTLFDLCRLLRGYRSPEEAASGLWKPGTNPSENYDLYKIDFEKVTIQRVRFPVLSFRGALGKALKPKKGIRTGQKGMVDRSKGILETAKRTLKDTRKMNREMTREMRRREA